MKTLTVWVICQNEAPRSEVVVDQPCNSVGVTLLLEKKSSWLTVFLQNSALEYSLDFVLHFLRQVSLYYRVLGFRLQHFDSKSEAFLDKESMTNRLLHVDCQKRFPMYQANSMYLVADFWSLLSIPQRRGTIAG